MAHVIFAIIVSRLLDVHEQAKTQHKKSCAESCQQILLRVLKRKKAHFCIKILIIVDYNKIKSKRAFQ